MMRRSFLVSIFVAMSGCSAGRHYNTDAATFVDLANRPATSLAGYTFVGATAKRAYLSVWSGMPWLLGGGEDVYSVALDELPPALADAIRAGRNPWATAHSPRATHGTRDANFDATTDTSDNGVR